MQERVEVARKSTVGAAPVLDGLELVAHARRDDLIRAGGDVTQERDDEVAGDVGADRVGVGRRSERVGGQAPEHVSSEDRCLLAGCHLTEHVQCGVARGLVTSEDVVQQDGAEPLLLRSGGGAAGAQCGRSGRRWGSGVEADAVAGLEALQDRVRAVLEGLGVAARLRLELNGQESHDVLEILLDVRLRVGDELGAETAEFVGDVHDVSFPDVLFVPYRVTGLVEQGAGALRRNAERSILKVLSGERSEFLVEPDIMCIVLMWVVNVPLRA